MTGDCAHVPGDDGQPLPGLAAAVADFGRLHMTGWFSWMLWSFVRIYCLIGFRNRLAVFLNWAWAYITFGRGARLITTALTRDGAGKSHRKAA